MRNAGWIDIGYMYTPSPGNTYTKNHYGKYVASASDYVECVYMVTDGDNAYLMEYFRVTIRGRSRTIYNSGDKWLSRDSGDTNSAVAYKFCY